MNIRIEIFKLNSFGMVRTIYLNLQPKTTSEIGREAMISNYRHAVCIHTWTAALRSGVSGNYTCLTLKPRDAPRVLLRPLRGLDLPEVLRLISDIIEHRTFLNTNKIQR